MSTFDGIVPVVPACVAKSHRESLQLNPVHRAAAAHAWAHASALLAELEDSCALPFRHLNLALFRPVAKRRSGLFSAQSATVAVAGDAAAAVVGVVAAIVTVATAHGASASVAHAAQPLQFTKLHLHGQVCSSCVHHCLQVFAAWVVPTALASASASASAIPRSIECNGIAPPEACLVVVLPPLSSLSSGQDTRPNSAAHQSTSTLARDFIRVVRRACWKMTGTW